MVKKVKGKSGKSDGSAVANDAGENAAVRKKKKVVKVKVVKAIDTGATSGATETTAMEPSSNKSTSCELCDGLILPVGSSCRA
eukprot:2688714-Amphidinium_carterae.1